MAKIFPKLVTDTKQIQEAQENIMKKYTTWKKQKQTPVETPKQKPCKQDNWMTLKEK